jgi:hypothetical protein
MQLQRITAWRIATPAVYLTYGIEGHAALLPVQLLSVLQQQLFASVAYSTAMEQLEGSRPVLAAGASSADVDSSWGPVSQVTSQHSAVHTALRLPESCNLMYWHELHPNAVLLVTAWLTVLELQPCCTTCSRSRYHTAFC